MRAAPTGKHEDAGIAPVQRVAVEFEAAISGRLSNGMDVLPDRPIEPVWIDLAPREPVVVLGRIAEVIDIVAGVTQRLDHGGLLLVPPRRGDVDFSHSAIISGECHSAAITSGRNRSGAT